MANEVIDSGNIEAAVNEYNARHHHRINGGCTAVVSERFQIDESGEKQRTIDHFRHLDFLSGGNIPANTILRCKYNNKSGTVKIFSFDIEYLY